MKTKILKKILFLIISILGIYYYLFFISENRFFNRTIIFSENIIVSEDLPAIENTIFNLPIRLTIPKIDVDAEVVSIGITPTWLLDIPDDITKVGLYHLWPIPWEKGSAVIDGHFGWINKKPAVFNNLFKLQKWDEIHLHDDEWNIVIFIVNQLKIYDQNDDTTDIFNSNDWQSHLNIITCGWVWDKTKQSYTKRLVVFSDKVIE